MINVSEKVAGPCPITIAHFEFVSRMYGQDTTLYRESSTSGRKNLARFSQQVIRKPQDLHFAQLKIVKQQICELHTPFQSVGKDLPPAYAGKDH